MNVNPGELNKKIEIVKINKKTGTKTSIRSCWAKIVNMSGADIKKGNIEIADVKTRFLIRYTTTQITNEMSIIYKNQIYNVIYPNNYGESNEYIEILAEHKGACNES